jgi:hypothetical protein
LGEIERGLREPEPEGLDYLKVGLGLVLGGGGSGFAGGGEEQGDSHSRR